MSAGAPGRPGAPPAKHTPAPSPPAARTPAPLPRSPRARGTAPAFALAILLALATAACTAVPAACASTPATAAVTRVNGVPCLGAGDLARLLDGSLWWRADLRKLVLRAQGHRLTFTVDAPVMLVDDRTARLDGPVCTLGGEVQVPVSVLAVLPRDSSAVRLVLEAGGTRVRATPAAGWVGAPRVALAGELTRVTFTTAHPEDARVGGRVRTHFRVWFPGAPAAAGGDTLPGGALVRSCGRLAGGDGVTWEFSLDPAATSFRRSVSPEGVVVEFSRTPLEGFEPLAAEGPGPRTLRVIVLDPGHGGADAGTSVPGAVEKDLALRLARVLAPELERRTGARVLLTRDADRAVSQPDRAETANRARADLVLSLHFDGAPLTRAHGATAWCPPLEASEDAAAFSSSGITLTPWRDVAVRHAMASRALADIVTRVLAVRGLGPARVRERLPVSLLGVNAPGIALECATLTAPDDLARVGAPEGLRTLASAIADGVQEWARHE